MSKIYSRLENVMACKLQSAYTLPDFVKPSIRKLIYELKERWKKSRRMENRFLTNNEGWLEAFVTFQNEEENYIIGDRGRPSIDFAASTDRSKRRKTEYLRTEATAEELTYATQMKLRAEGKVDAAKILKVVRDSDTEAKQCLKFLQDDEQEVFTADEALSLFIELQFSKNKYQQLRNAVLKKKVKLFPSYKVLSKARQECYPRTNIVVSESSAEIKLQPLLDHTTSRILYSQLDAIKHLSIEQLKNLVLIGKWGCDGSSGHSTYKQNFNVDPEKTDENILFTSFLPLQLIHVNESTKQTMVIWKNPRPSSPRFCRSINIQFLRETNEVIVEETAKVQKQVQELIHFETILNGKETVVNYQLKLTMIDGKVCNAITSTLSSQRCYLCKATSKDFNNIDFILRQQIEQKNLEFGLSSLHAWIRLFECCLHLSYKLDIKKWQLRTDEDKQSVQLRKEHIQKGFKKELGLIVDKPKSGYGSTNDGNTARRFFENYKISASLTGVDEEIIYRFYILLQTLSSGYGVNIEKFKNYALETARKFVQLYPWYYMPTTVHKILIHGFQIISHALLPIGQMSEDAQESCNKFFKNFRENFSRKSARAKTMEDVFKRFLISSDPFISSCRKLPAKPLKYLSPEVITMLLPPSVTVNDDGRGDQGTFGHFLEFSDSLFLHKKK